MNDEKICIREIKENIKRVFNNQPLTKPLRVLNRSCEFKKRYDIACDLIYGEAKNQKRKEYYQKNKEKMREYRKEYYQRPEVKEKRREQNKEYYQKNKK